MDVASSTTPIETKMDSNSTEQQFLVNRMYPYIIKQIKRRMQSGICHSAYEKGLGILTQHQYAIFLEGKGEITEIERPDRDNFGNKLKKTWKSHEFYNPECYDKEDCKKIPNMGEDGWYEFHMSDGEDPTIDMYIRLLYITFFWNEEYEELQYSMKYEVQKKFKNQTDDEYTNVP